MATVERGCLAIVTGYRRTRATMRMRPEGDAQAQASLHSMLPMLLEWARRSGEALATLLDRVQAEGAPNAEPPGN